MFAEGNSCFFITEYKVKGVKRVKKIESFLEWNSWIFRMVIFFLWIFWAAQIFFPFLEDIQKEIKYQRSRDWQIEKYQTVEMAKFLKEKVKNARLKSSVYGPWQYFADLKDFDKKSKELPNSTLFPASFQLQLEEIFYQNLEKGRYTWEELKKARNSYEKSRPFNKEAIRWSSVFSWFVTFYLRSMFLVLFLYLIRMSERKGILATILADKQKFLLSVFGWTFFLFKYPYNVVREIIVEAELRRLGKIFRRLSPQEQQTVRDIAASSYYYEYLFVFCQKNRSVFQRTLATTVIGTLLLHVFAPFFNISSYSKKRDGPLVICINCVNVETTDSNAIDGDNTANKWAVPEMSIPIIAPELSGRTKILWNKIRPREIFKKIDHIPLSQLFSWVY